MAASKLQLRNTNCGGYFLGNFDLTFDGSNCHILVRVAFRFRDASSANQQARFKERFFRAIKRYWSQPGFALARGMEELPITISCREANEGEPAHKKIVIKPRIIVSGNRELVIHKVYLKPGSSERIMAHEFGHILGLKDEYPAPTLWERTVGALIWRVKDYEQDKAAMMHSGTEQRARYFEHIAQTLSRLVPGNPFKIQLVK